MDDAALVHACQGLDRDAQRELYELHVDCIYRLAFRITRNEQDAFDVTQQTFIRAFEHISSFDQRSTIRTWLYRIGTNEALQLVRRRGTERRHLSVLEHGLRDSAPASGTDHLDLEEAMLRLSDDHHAILMLRYKEGLDYQEIATVLEVNAGTVASRLNRARGDLRRLLAENSALSVEETTSKNHPTDTKDVSRQCKK